MASRSRRVAGSPPHRRDSQVFLNEAWYAGRQRNVWAMLACVQMKRSAICLVVRTSGPENKVRIVRLTPNSRRSRQSEFAESALDKNQVTDDAGGNRRPGDRRSV